MKTTNELKNEIAKTKNMEKWMIENKKELQEYSLAQYLDQLLHVHGCSKKEVIASADLDAVYGYQIFQGKKNPSRSNLLKLAFGFSLTVEETEHLLYYGKAEQLYPRVKRDAYILYALHQKYTLQQANQYLYDKGEEPM